MENLFELRKELVKMYKSNGGKITNEIRKFYLESEDKIRLERFKNKRYAVDIGNQIVSVDEMLGDGKIAWRKNIYTLESFNKIFSYVDRLTLLSDRDPVDVYKIDENYIKVYEKIQEFTTKEIMYRIEKDLNFHVIINAKDVPDDLILYYMKHFPDNKLEELMVDINGSFFNKYRRMLDMMASIVKFSKMEEK